MAPTSMKMVKPLSNILIQMKKRKYLEEVSAEK